GLTLLFFFASGRRHTRSKRDWSSDVCSSDLRAPGQALDPVDRPLEQVPPLWPPPYRTRAVQQLIKGLAWGPPTSRAVWAALESRSEERRVGKAWTSRGVTNAERVAFVINITW